MQRAVNAFSTAAPDRAGGISNKTAGATRRGLLAGLAIVPALAAAPAMAAGAWRPALAAYRANERCLMNSQAMAARAAFGPHVQWEDESMRLCTEMCRQIDALVKIPAPDLQALADKLDVMMFDEDRLEQNMRYAIADVRRLGGLA